MTDTDPLCVVAARRLGDLLADAGHEVTDDAPSGFDDRALGWGYVTMFNVHTATELARVGRIVGRELTADDVEPDTWSQAEAGRAVDAVTYWEATEGMRTWVRKIAAWWTDHDLLVTPTIPVPPPRLGEVETGVMFPFVMPFNVTGQPAISIPGATTPDGLPIGVQLIGAYGREDLVLAAASTAIA